MSLLTKRFSSLLPTFSDEPFFNDWNGDRFWFSKVPPVNIIEKDNEYWIEMAVPGMTKNDFHVTCENGLLTITAEKEERKEEKDKDYTRREYNYNTFSRTFTLPDYVKSEQVKAQYENGMLRMTLPFKAEAKATRKEIKIS